ncbi:MAG: CcrColossus [Sphingomonas bacterium]|nr:CcrColossus [Sphingomonas bacterium]
MTTERRIPETWFRASGQHTTMAFISGTHQARTTPLGPGERRLGWFVLPPFQRPPVWTLAQQVRFLESCWMGLPIGVFIYNRTANDGPYDSWLLDGQQRVTAVLAYMADAFPVFGYRFSELTQADLRKWSMAVAFPCMMTNLESEDQLREVYDRLAYGGTPHEPKSPLANATQESE